MHKATITSRSEISGESVYTVEDENLLTFYAQIVGAVQGITAAGSVVVSVISSRSQRLEQGRFCSSNSDVDFRVKWSPRRKWGSFRSGSTVFSIVLHK